MRAVIAYDETSDADSSTRLTGLLAVVLAPERSQSDVAQPHGIALAGPHAINDAPGDHLIHDGRLPGVVQFLAGAVEGLAHDLGHSIVKHGTRLSDKRQYGAHVSFPRYAFVYDAKCLGFTSRAQTPRLSCSN